MKKNRELIFSKYGGKCAYCGCDLQKGWHVDHIEAIYRNWNEDQLTFYGIKKGEESIENYNPSCARCNVRKTTWTIEQFREQITLQVDRMKRDSSSFRLALDYESIKETKADIKVYFEKKKNTPI